MSLPSLAALPKGQSARKRLALSPVLLGSMLSLVLLLLWDASGLDLWMATLFGDARGFPLQNHWLWNDVLHDKIKPFTWALEIALLLGIAVPFSVLRALPVSRRAQLALTTLVALLLVSSIKLRSATSCPWDLQQFGGAAIYVSHWARGVLDGGGGGCFPAGHASAGFAFLGGFFVFRHRHPALAWYWLAGTLALGLLLGVAQQIRGAHYMSHTLWTAWLCWTCAALMDWGVTQFTGWQLRRAAFRSA